MKTCPECDGEGVIEKGTDDEQRCPMCGGSGFVPDDDDEREDVIRTERAEVQESSAGQSAASIFWWDGRSFHCLRLSVMTFIVAVAAWLRPA